MRRRGNRASVRGPGRTIAMPRPRTPLPAFRTGSGSSRGASASCPRLSGLACAIDRCDVLPAQSRQEPRGNRVKNTTPHVCGFRTVWPLDSGRSGALRRGRSPAC